MEVDEASDGTHAQRSKENMMKIGDYVVIQRKNYSKIHKISNKLSVMIGNNQLELDNIIGRPFSTTFRMVPKEKKRNVFVLEECSKAESLVEKLIKDVASGTDNRNIVGDNSSQKLSKEEIVSLRDSGMSGCDIVSQLLENSKTFQEKTEYSQKKYLSKKEKKYFDYVLIRKPTLRLVCDIIYKQDPMKIIGLRCDTLSQLITGVGVSSGGTYIVYESSCEGLPTAALLNYLGDDGYLVHTFPGMTPQRQAIFAMNYSESQKKRLISVSIMSLMEKLNKKVAIESSTSHSQTGDHVQQDINNGGESGHSELTGVTAFMSSSCGAVMNDESGRHVDVCPDTNLKQSVEETEFSRNELLTGDQLSCDRSDENNHFILNSGDIRLDDSGSGVTHQTLTSSNDGREEERIFHDLKRKNAVSEMNEVKKPRWEVDLDRAVDLLSPQNVDGLVVVGREDPADIVLQLLPYLAPSRNFAVYSWCREPLVELYIKLKKDGGVINAHLTETFFRTHQVLPNRTHPDIQMSGSGGYILLGTVVLQHSPKEKNN
ncbi:tRNA (adenine(58)-N(1))-methyltransferase non-catalytic subunit TRM6 [Schistocerca serialis cubense]|uniref:tRNA (adenine(58)-N(1))-methyltransferase non-catalytic subunit TRM6 n=1 Tax=Schistocerca serialis cubense TaxID=2023355 RepID=UPI00214EFE11|nr:tRNA (adenine(58)-N(1))-methyltransferase non-catalytic subunit TRM6 [Schistocerca serialis cubense]XP_049949214.1 tRNA (adenine(58)-N(1))-methyltransferase non-catalytic subunit TRM6 [Schistocerca serialis cubense]XP_049949215.1 tRNA (adenine(58)-N(1))-methyltransferase non-catalytic subunit TRM6 [Schistocerca serialis cubense]XP_049949216.1 tRNA (adenine(58)-N(1))-methyltransferase non-catalytic subunit TRM6 [Schistocerca serialis cubense]